MSKIIRWSIERPRTILGAWLVLILCTAPFAVQLSGALVAGGFTAPHGEAARAQATLGTAFHEAPNTQVVVLYAPAGGVAAAVPAAVAAVADIPGVSGVVDYRTQPTWLSKDGRTTFLDVGFTSDDTTVQNLTPVLRARVAAKVGSGVQTDVTGVPALNYQLNEDSEKDATRAELIAFPVLLIVLLLVFRSVAAMAVPLVLAGVTLAIAEGAGYGFAKITDLNSLFANIVSMIGLAVSVDYSLFIIKRHREELAAGRSVPEAIERTMRTVGHSVLVSALAVVAALSSLFLTRAMAFTSIALGGVIVAVVAGAIVMTLLPAVLVLLGERINWGTIGRRGRRAPDGARAGGAGTGRAGTGALDAAATGVALTAATTSGGAATRIGERILRYPALILVVLVAVFAALASPAARLTWQVPVASATILPPGDGPRVGFERIQQNIGLRGLFPIEVVLTAPANRADELLRATTRIASYARTAPDSAGVRAVTTLGLPSAALPALLTGGATTLPPADRAALGQLWTRDGNTLVTRVVVTAADDPDTSAAHALVVALRDRDAVDATGAVTARIAGATAGGVDFDGLVRDSAPLVVLTVALLSLLILTLAFRSVLLPLLALAFNALVVAGSLGVLALTSADGDHVINSVTPLMLFAVMFGLSMDYMVVMISRMREHYRDGMTHQEAVMTGLARTAGLVNGAAVIMIAVFLAFLSADISVVRELGICLAAAVALDALVIRRLVMPATLLLIGRRLWGRAASVQPVVLVPKEKEEAV